ncbi:hypothetical protein U3A58_12230 [Algoriphagus sp. C2-6-M1]|nr:hypothetical protein [Algoriphagus sp. C2-6-M1]
MEKNWQLIKVDSIQIPFLGTPRLDDVDPKNRRLVFMQSGQNEDEVFVANFDGEILHSFGANGNTLVGRLGLMAPLKFDSEGRSLLAFGFPHIKKISLDGEQVDVLYTGNTAYQNSFPRPSNELVASDGKIFYNNHMHDQEFRSDREEFYKKISLIGFVDLEKNERINFLKFPNESMFVSGRIFPAFSWDSHFAFSDEHLNVVFEGEPSIFVFESQSPFSFIKKIDLNLQEFQYYKGVQEGEQVADFMEHMRIMGKMSSIKILDNKILVFYTSGFSSQQLKTWETASSANERNDMINRFRKETPPRIQVLDSEYNLLADFAIPSHIIPSGIFERDGFLWAGKSNPDEEEDFFTIYKFILDQVESQVTDKN